MGSSSTKKSKIRGMLCNMPNVDAFITRRTATYIGKIARSDNDALPKKFLAAWINKSKKSGAPQLTCNNNFAESIQKYQHQRNPYHLNKPRCANGSIQRKMKPAGCRIQTNTLNYAAILILKTQKIPQKKTMKEEKEKNSYEQKPRPNFSLFFLSPQGQARKPTIVGYRAYGHNSNSSHLREQKMQYMKKSTNF